MASNTSCFLKVKALKGKKWERESQKKSNIKAQNNLNREEMYFIKEGPHKYYANVIKYYEHSM